MVWKRQKSSVTPLPEEPSLLLWLVAGFAALVAGGFIFIFHANQLLGSWQHHNIWLLSAALPGLWFVAICLRGWRYNNRVDKHQFELKEADYTQQQWTAWGGRYLAVLHSEVILPDSFTATRLIPGDASLPMCSGLVRRLPADNEKTWLLKQLESAEASLLQLPPDITLNVFLLTDAAQEASHLQATFRECWRQVMPAERPAPVAEIVHSYSFAAVEQRIKTAVITAELILVQQMNGGEHYSDAVATLLLTTDDVASRYELSHPVRLLRPMALEEGDLSDQLDRYFSIQRQAINTQYIIADTAQWGRAFAALYGVREQYQAHQETTQLHTLERYSGLCGPFSPWIVTAMISDVIKIHQADCLMLSESEGQRFINTMTTGINHEHS
ncbi:hypothetical protein PT300_10495 [Enterobacteriaceae bacterium ESL0689]|nr:hypothetical protein [Enterobacteriaceae bacterium ESL0689]